MSVGRSSSTYSTTLELKLQDVMPHIFSLLTDVLIMDPQSDITLKAAGTGRYDRAVAFYGMIRLPEAWRGPGQGEPLDFLARPDACPVLAILGGRDPYTPPEDIETLRGLGDRVTVVVYPEANHGFVHDPSRPTHRPDDAADAWRRVAEFLV